MTTIKIVVGILCIIFIFMAGCLSTCIPVKIEAKYPNANDGATLLQTVIINGEAMPIYANAYKKISINETIFVKFESNPTGTVINSICDGEEK